MPNPQTERDEFTLKEKLQYAAIGLVLIGGSFHWPKADQECPINQRGKKTYDDGNAAYYAQKLKLAFENDMWFGMGTDEEAVRNVIRSIPTKDEFKKIINSYQKLYASSLMMDLKNELTTSEYNEMMAIIAGKPENASMSKQFQIGQPQYQAWAQRLKAAFDINYWFMPGTDEDAIKAVFMELPTQDDFQKTALAYKNLYGSDLIKDLKSELEFWEYGTYMAIINNKPKA